MPEDKRLGELEDDLGHPHVVGDLGLDIETYYAAAASTYDKVRFGNSYGRYVDAQERAALRSWLAGAARVLEIGCGTGRLLDLATDGIDRSSEMLAVAHARHPGRRLLRCRGSATPFQAESFDAIFSMHVFMHLPKAEVVQVLDECHRLLKPGGSLVFDVPSQPRRRISGFQPASWHCGTAYSPEELRSACGAWRWRGFRGLLAFPIHRLPQIVRLMCRPLDGALGRTPLRRWCSYYLVRLEKRK